jgi:hypothetical protein
MTTQAEIEEFARKSYEREMRALRRFLPDAVPPTGFQDDLAPFVKTRLELGRRTLLQFPDFQEIDHV